VSNYYWYSGNSSIASLASNPANSFGQYQPGSPGSTYSAVNVEDNLGCQGSGTGQIVVRGPDHVMVRGDTSGVGTCTPSCYGSIQRVISYQVVFSDNTNDNNVVPIQESLSNISTNTCGTGTPEPTACGNAQYGQFLDTYDTNYTSTTNPIPSCGYREDQLYQWCQSGASVTIAHLPNDQIYSDYITVNGVTTPNAMGAGTMIH
jgi:hypothetical protein